MPVFKKLAASRIGAGILAGCVLMTTGAVSAQNNETVAPSVSVNPPNCDSEAFRHFDFWVGEWRVTGVDDDILAGTNAITRLSGGCAILEQWQGAQGGPGQSYNYYDSQNKVWRQLWTSASNIIDISGPVVREGHLLMTGTIYYRGPGNSQPFKGEWSLQVDGSIIQHFQQKTSEDAEWSDWFVGRYRPIESGN